MVGKGNHDRVGEPKGGTGRTSITSLSTSPQVETVSQVGKRTISVRFIKAILNYGLYAYLFSTRDEREIVKLMRQIRHRKKQKSV